MQTQYDILYNMIASSGKFVFFLNQKRELCNFFFENRDLSGGHPKLHVPRNESN